MTNTLTPLPAITPVDKPDIAVSHDRVIVTAGGNVRWFDKQRELLGQAPVHALFSELGAENPQPAQVVWNSESGDFTIACVEARSDRHQVIYTATGQPGDWVAQATYVSQVGASIRNLSLATHGDGIMFTFDFDPEFPGLGCWMGAASKDRLTNPDLGIINFAKLSTTPRSFVAAGDPLVSVTLNSGAFQRVWITGHMEGGYMASNWLQLPWRTEVGPIQAAYTDGSSVWITHTVNGGDNRIVQWYKVNLRAWPGSGPKPIVEAHGMIDVGADASAPDLAVSGGMVMFAFSAGGSIYTEPGGLLREGTTEPAIAADPSKPGRFYVYSDVLDVAMIADLNGDGVVDSADLGMLLAEWGSDGGRCDLNADGIVDTADLGILLGEMK